MPIVFVACTYETLVLYALRACLHGTPWVAEPNLATVLAAQYTCIAPKHPVPARLIACAVGEGSSRCRAKRRKHSASGPRDQRSACLDGSGNPGSTRRRYTQRRIARLGRLDSVRATRRIDAKGKTCHPGIIDLHSHADDGASSRGGSAMGREAARRAQLVMQGVTTVCKPGRAARHCRSLSSVRRSTVRHRPEYDPSGGPWLVRARVRGVTSAAPHGPMK